MITLVSWCAEVALLLRIFWMTGIANAAVFPEPVRARTKTSLPSKTRGMARSWIGVGSLHPTLAIAYSKNSCFW